MCYNQECYKYVLVDINECLENHMDKDVYTNVDILSVTLSWGILRSDANLTHPQVAHTNLVPKYSYEIDSEVFYYHVWSELSNSLF